MRLIIVRHGQTDYNVQGIMQGLQEKSLNGEGQAQAKKVAQRLQHEKIDLVYSSDLPRALETAQEIVAYHPQLKLIYNTLVRERDYGIYDGKHRDVYLAAWKKTNKPYIEFKPDGGESILELRHRAVRFYEQLKQLHQQETILIVSHGSFIRTFIAALLNEASNYSDSEYFKSGPHNTGVNIINVGKDGRCTAEVLNCIKHLE